MVRAGSRVRVRFENGTKYRGTVKRVRREDGNPVALTIDYDDGTCETADFPDHDVEVMEDGVDESSEEEADDGHDSEEEEEDDEDEDEDEEDDEVDDDAKRAGARRAARRETRQQKAANSCPKYSHGAVTPLYRSSSGPTCRSIEPRAVGKLFRFHAQRA